MLTPRYIFAGEFRDFHTFFLSQPHTTRHSAKGETIWQPGAPHAEIHYIVRGSEMHFALHESGRRRIISFHGAGTVFPGFHTLDFQIERALVTEALSDMDVLAFTKDQFRAMFAANTALAETVVNWHAAYINRFLFETVHQGYNPALLKLANLLYLLTQSDDTLTMTQDALAELLGLSRVQITRALSSLRSEGIIATRRSAVEVIDRAALAARCSAETTGAQSTSARPKA